MQHCPEIEFNEAFGLPYWLQHAHGYKEASDPEESIDCEVGSRDQGGHSWSGQYLDGLSPVLYVDESKPHVVAEDYPEDG